MGVNIFLQFFRQAIIVVLNFLGELVKKNFPSLFFPKGANLPSVITNSISVFFKVAVVFPIAMLYLTLLATSFSLIVYAFIQVINNIFDIINSLNGENGSQSLSAPVRFLLTCPLAFLDSIGILPSLNVGLSLFVSDILALALIKANIVGKKTFVYILQVQKLIR